MSVRLAPPLAAALAALAWWSSEARADDREAAAAAYDRGTQAFEAGRFREAAAHFRDADRAAPSAAALSAALESAVRTDDPGLVMSLCELAEARTGDAELASTAARARERFGPRAGKLVPRCATAPAPADGCTLRVAGESWTPGVPRWISAGDHVVVLDRGRGEERFPVVVPAGGTLSWAPPAPGPAPGGAPSTGAPPPAPPASASPPPGPAEGTTRDGGGPSPAWFFVGLGATAVLGGAAIGTGVATLGQHDEFEAAPSEEARSDGLLLQNVTNGLVAGAAVAGVATLVLAFVVDWSGDEPASSRGAPVLVRF